MRQVPPVLPAVPRRFQYLLSGQKFSRHRHRVAHLSVVLSGSFEEEGDDGHLRAGPGTVLFRPAFSTHAQEVLGPTRIFNAPLPPGFVPTLICGAIADPEEAVRRWERDPTEALGWLADRMSPFDYSRQDWPDHLAAMLRRGCRLQDWAARNGLHPASLARRFRSFYGTSPANYRTEQRARRALNEILETDEPLPGLAYDLGFADQAHMCRAIRSLTGLSPGQWRRLKKFKIAKPGGCDTADMNRRDFNSAAIASVAVTLSGCAARPAVNIPAVAADARTIWSVTESEGYDALCFWAPLAGDPESSRQYAEEVRQFAPKMDPRALEAIKAIYQQVAAAGNVMTHSACRLFSAGPHDTIDDLIASAGNIDTILKPRHLDDSEWEGEELWERYRQLMPIAAMILGAMKAAGFSEFRQRLYHGKHAGRVGEVTQLVNGYNVIAEVQRLTGRAFEPQVDIALTYFSYPRGMRMLGQQFVTWAGYSDDTILNTSAHELMHPPLNLRGRAMQAAISKLFANGFWVAVVTKRDPSLGDVGDLPNYVEECMVQALDQMASERRGSPRRAADFFARNKGSDVLAACFYGLLKQDGYDRTGGNFEQWVERAVATGRFDPEPLDSAGAAVLGASPRSVWQPFQPARP